ncbi:hypothetical protein [Brasilonema sp. UFV-L1]|uniref:hypothetical protein n=1 Tax=Brasilonema sp. UFV-L1 TaxID=2234130 RepID=UPI00145F9923|nr:hypothetical protein [Brasilonema sp. UFV-L1]
MQIQISPGTGLQKISLCLEKTGLIRSPISEKIAQLCALAQKNIWLGVFFV